LDVEVGKALTMVLKLVDKKETFKALTRSCKRTFPYRDVPYKRKTLLIKAKQILVSK